MTSRGGEGGRRRVIGELFFPEGLEKTYHRLNPCGDDFVDYIVVVFHTFGVRLC